MSRRLYADPDRLPAWATRLRCPRCKQEWTVEEAREEAIDGAGRLVCWDCGEPAYGEGYGLIALRGESALEKTGGRWFDPIPRALLRGEYGPRDPVERAVLFVLWSYASGDGWAWPSVRTLARATGYGETAVKSALRRLRGQGLRVDERPGATTRYLVAPMIRGGENGGTQASPAPHPGVSRRGTQASPAHDQELGEGELRDGEPADAGSRAADAAARHSREDPSSSAPDDWWGEDG